MTTTSTNALSLALERERRKLERQLATIEATKAMIETLEKEIKTKK